MSFALALKEPLDAGSEAGAAAGAAAPAAGAIGALDPTAGADGATDGVSDEAGAIDGAIDGAGALGGDDNDAEISDDTGDTTDTAELGDPGLLAEVSAGAGVAGPAVVPEAEAPFGVAVSNQAVTHPW